MALSGILGMIIASSMIAPLSVLFGVVTIAFGLLILWKPNIIAYLIAVYLILVGLGMLIGGLM